MLGNTPREVALFVLFNPIVKDVILFVGAGISTAIINEAVSQLFKNTSSLESLRKTHTSLKSKSSKKLKLVLFIIAFCVFLLVGNYIIAVLKEGICKKMITERYEQYREDMINAVNSKDASIVYHNYKNRHCQIADNSNDLINKFTKGQIHDCYEQSISNKLDDFIFDDEYTKCTAKGFEKTLVTQFDNDGEFLRRVVCDEEYEYSFEFINHRDWLMVEQITVYQK